MDTYSDSYGLTVKDFGASLLFLESLPAVMGHPEPAPRPVALIRMGLPMLKLLAFQFATSVNNYERLVGGEIPVAAGIMNDYGIPREDWDQFWKRG